MKRLLVVFLAVSSLSYAANSLTVDSLDVKIINLTFNDEFKEVKNICDSLIELYPKNPKYYFFYFGADALQLHEQINSFPLNERDSLREVLVDRAINKLEKSIRTLSDIPHTTSDMFFIASLHGYYSRYAGLNGYWWAAYINGTKANGMFEKIIDEHPNYYDAYLYPGVFGYYAARLNGFNGFIASVLGVSGDREEGINYINISLREGKLVYPQALLMLLEINTVMEDNPFNAEKYFVEFMSAYPKNKRVANWYGHTMLNIYKAKAVGERITNDSVGVTDSFVKAKYYFLTEQIDSAVKYSELSLSHGNTWKGIIEHTRYYSVYLKWLSGDKEIIHNYKSKLNSFYSSLFELDINNEYESKYIYNLTSLVVKGEYGLFKKLTKQHNNFNEKYFKAEFNLLNGIVLFDEGDLSNAILFFERAENTPDFRKRTIALRYQMDIFLKKIVKKEKVEDLIKRIEDTDFDKLTFRLDDLKKKYNL